MKRKPQLPIPESEKTDIIRYLKRLNTSQKQKIIAAIRAIKSKPDKKE